MSNIQRETYDGTREITSDPFDLIARDNRNHAKKQRRIRAAMQATPGDRVCEVGCGHGLHARAYDREFEYVGVDLSHSLARATATRLDAGRAIQADATALPFPTDRFASVVGTAILHHIARQREALREWVRVTESGGTVVLMEPNYWFPKAFVSTHLEPEERHKRSMTPPRLRALCDGLPAGVEVEPCIYTPPWPRRVAGLYDRLDDLARRVPGLRWASQLLRITLTAD